LRRAAGHVYWVKEERRRFRRARDLTKAMKRRWLAVGLHANKVPVHSLRQLGAELSHEASGDVRETQMLLDHSGLDTTSITMKQLTGEEHRHWHAMVNGLAVV